MSFKGTASLGSKPCRLPKRYLNVLRNLRYESDRRSKMSFETRMSSAYIDDATHSRSTSAPICWTTSCGETALPTDLDLFLPSPSTTKPWVSTDLNGAPSPAPHERSSDD